MTLRSSLLSSLSSQLIRPLGVGVMLMFVSVPAFAEDPVPRASAVMPVTQAAPLDPSGAPIVTMNPVSAPVVPPQSDTLKNPNVVPSLSDALSKVPGGESSKELAAQVADADPSIDGPAPGMDLPVVTVETPEDAQMKMRDEAFEGMMNGVLPMNPGELREAFGRMDVNQKAIEEPLKFPKPEVSFTTVSLDPATEPLTFKLATGHVTTVSFLDITGQPWPIKDVTWAGNFEVKSSSQGVDEKFPMYPNLMRIIPLSEYAYGNMSIRLLGLSTPLTFTLRTNKDEVQYRLDLRVPAEGPFAVPSIINTGGNTLKAGNATLTKMMEGVPPDNAKRLKISGVDGRTSVYTMNDTLYVRTPLTLLSPAWTESVRSADGMNVYALGAAPVLLLSDQGQMVRASLMDTQGHDHDEP